MPPYIIAQLERGVATTDRKLTNLFRMYANGTTKTRTWDLREELPEKLEDHIYERNARARMIAICRGHDYTPLVLEDYRKMAAELDAAMPGVDGIKEMDAKIAELYAESERSDRTGIARLLGTRNIRAMEKKVPLRGLDSYKKEAVGLRRRRIAEITEKNLNTPNGHRGTVWTEM